MWLKRAAGGTFVDWECCLDCVNVNTWGVRERRPASPGTADGPALSPKDRRVGSVQVCREHGPG